MKKTFFTLILTAGLLVNPARAVHASDFFPHTMTQSGALALGAGISFWANVWTDDWVLPTTASAGIAWVALRQMEQSLIAQGYTSTDYRTKVHYALLGSIAGMACGKSVRYGGKKTKQAAQWVWSKIFGHGPRS